MGSTPGTQKNKEAQTQNEGPIASRLKSKTKIGDAQASNIEHTPGTYVKKSSDKPSQNSRNQKDNKSKKSAEKKGEVLHTPSTNRASQPSSTDNNHPTKKTNGSTPKIIENNASSSSTTPPSDNHHHGTNKIIIKDSTSDGAKRRRQDSKKQNANSSSDRASQNSSKNNNRRPKKMENNSAAKKSNNLPMPSSSTFNNGQKNKKKNKASQKPAMNNSTKDRPVYYIRWKGFDTATATGWNCAFCEKDLAYSPDTEEYNEDYSSSDNEEEYKLEHIFTSRMGLELEQHSPLLPEVSVLPCTHTFHSMCLNDAEMDLTDSPCPICISFF